MRSPIYWHPMIYQSVMRLLYGKYFESRYRAIAQLIPDNSSVTEVCAGDSYLYMNYLRKKNVKYMGLDINPSFISHAEKNNIPFAKHDLMTDPIPISEYIIIHGSLCQFMPLHGKIVEKLLDSTRVALIVAEPVRNLSTSSNPLIAFIAKHSANAGEGHPTERFNQETLMNFFRQYKEFKEAQEIEGGREIIGVFKK